MNLYEVLSVILFMTDSMKVVEWFTSTKSKLKAEFGIVPSLAFYHIPVHAMLEYQRGGLHPHRNPGSNRESVNPQGTLGWSYDSQDMKFMKALVETEGLVAGFSGHDHLNDWYAFRFAAKNILRTVLDANH